MSFLSNFGLLVIASDLTPVGFASFSSMVPTPSKAIRSIKIKILHLMLLKLFCPIGSK
jgi:hypothetical protein